MALDYEDRRIIDADRSFPDSRSWRLGKWIGEEEFKPEWLKLKEQADQLTKGLAHDTTEKSDSEA